MRSLTVLQNSRELKNNANLNLLNISVAFRIATSFEKLKKKKKTRVRASLKALRSENRSKPPKERTHLRFNLTTDGSSNG